MRPRTLAVICCSLLLIPALAAAQAWEGSTSVEALAEGGPIDGAELTPGEAILLVANVTPPEANDTAYRAFLNGTVDGEPINGSQSQSQGEPMALASQFDAPDRTGNATLAWTLTVQRRDVSPGGSATGNQTGNQTSDNRTSSNATAGWTTVEGFPRQGEASFTVQPLVPPEGPGLPWALIAGIGAVVVAGGAGAYWWSNRDRQIRGQARSQAMRELEGESFETTPEPKEPEVHPQLKILEARAEDVKRMIELAKDRHEQGDLTEHQYETIRDRKEAELEEIQAEMDEYREA